jgi:hypothetical protein
VIYESSHGMSGSAASAFLSRLPAENFGTVAAGIFWMGLRDSPTPGADPANSDVPPDND